ncbi:proteobacterial dedicated sortase system histidine kinase [Psychromonas sp. B3M02]|uniref:proteobacterial dedicated sortase system histidine kinase n=1 Tax=Psychromonas sp. B3M02 TaxID=2267226 RepID=UPI000DE90CB9|nr:proteobacterial dedicated sortase system histidine kinase [Psychromonas sp. B3M02]RBW47034.1 proteobacterial dedicated sortase system histidine kinase [Psychromonas sp. B3M02]
MSIKLGLRGKLLILSSLFLLLPWFAYQFVNEMERFLQAGQQQTLLGTTSGIAVALHERAALFNSEIDDNTDIENGHDLYVYNLDKPIILDGRQDDWQQIASFQNTYPTTPSLDINNPVKFEQLLGKQNGYLYAFFKVTNANPFIRSTQNQALAQGDHLTIALTSPQGELLRYIISVTGDGWFNAYRYPQHSLYVNKANREKSIQGIWKTTNDGYQIELRLPLTLLGNKLGFQLNTRSSSSSNQINQHIATSNLLDVKRLGSVLVPSPAIKNILTAMSHTTSRLWVVDRFQRVIANTGDIHQANGTWPTTLSNNQSGQSEPYTSLVNFIQEHLISPIYTLFLDQPYPDFIDKKNNPTRLNDALIVKALSGTPSTQWRSSADNKASILSAAQPIFVDGKVVGAVLAEETNHGLLSLRNQTLQRLFNVLFAILIIAGIVLFWFISKVVKRITALRNQSESMLDTNGRLTGHFVASSEQDEIGDLSRSMQEMVQRLAQYHHYVEQLASRLSHELRTPVAVVRSSLENLSSLTTNDKQQQKYIERSQQGIHRLHKILTNMSEASRIEQSLSDLDKQPIDLTKLVNGCIQGYQMIYPSSTLISPEASPYIQIDADPDFIVQLLDKLVHNAVEFSNSTDPIIFTLTKHQQDATLSIDNKGPLLVEGTQQDLFQSMVSIRPTAQQHDTHLGLGLYIAKMIADYHNADLKIANNSDLTGVTVTITFPII